MFPDLPPVDENGLGKYIYWCSNCYAPFPHYGFDARAECPNCLGSMPFSPVIKTRRLISRVAKSARIAAGVG